MEQIGADREFGENSSLSVRWDVLAKNHELCSQLALALADEGDAAGARMALCAQASSWLDADAGRVNAFIGAAMAQGDRRSRAEYEEERLAAIPGPGWLVLAESFAAEAAGLAAKLATGSAVDNGAVRDEREMAGEKMISWASGADKEWAPMARVLLAGCAEKELAWLCCCGAFGEVERGEAKSALEFGYLLRALAPSRHCAKACGELLSTSKVLDLPSDDANLKALLWAMAAKLPVEGWAAFRQGCPESLWSSLASQLWDMDNALAAGREIGLVSIALMHENWEAGKYLCSQAGCDPIRGIALAVMWLGAMDFLSSSSDLAEKKAGWTAKVESWLVDEASGPGCGSARAALRV